MGPFEIVSLTLVVAALAAWINERFLGLPTTIGVMVIALIASLCVVLFAPDATRESTAALLERIDFDDILLDVMLAFLLFAGALHVKIDQLYQQKRVIGGLATLGLLASTLMVGVFTWALVRALGIPLGFLPCLVFGALISPTDPIAVLGILKQAKAPKSIETKIAGESLFNDGVGVVVFVVLAGVAGHGGEHAVSASEVARLFAQEVLGALALGLVGGWIAYLMMASVDQYKVEVLITLALCSGLYTLALSLHSSGPLAVVVAGLFIGNRGRRLAMSEQTVERLDVFWELVDEILNVVLFVLIGMEVLVLTLEPRALWAGLAAIPLVLFARFLSVGGAVRVLSRWRAFTPHAVKIMTWGGLRGGISVALALSLPGDFPGRDLILVMTYVVVVFSIVVQGLTIGRLVRRIPEPEMFEDAPAH